VLATVVALAAVVALMEAWLLAAPVRGRVAAHTDVARGHYRFLTYGLPAAWRPEFARLLRERYHIELVPVAGCTVSESLISYVENYDQVSAAAANRKFGHDVFAECAEDAKHNWAKRIALNQ